MVAVATLTKCVSVFATVTTVGQFLSGIPSCRKIVRSGSTGELSGLPFIAAMFSCAMWTHYGFLRGDFPLTLVNSIGLLMQVVYIAVFWRYAVSKTSINQQIATSVGAVLIIVISTRLLTDNTEEAVLYQGLICCLATCFFCAAPLATLITVSYCSSQQTSFCGAEATVASVAVTAVSMFFHSNRWPFQSAHTCCQKAHVLRTRNTESLPFLWILMSFLVCSEWLLYGYLIQDVFVQFPNFVGMLLSGIQLSLFLFFPSHGSKIVPTVAVP